MAKSTPHEEAEKIRIQIQNVGDEIAWLASAPVPKEELKVRATEACRALAATFLEDGNPMRRLALPKPDSLLSLLKINASTFHRGEVVSTTAVEVGPIIAWCLGDILTQRMHAEIDSLDYQAGPPMADRPARLAKLKADLRRLEGQEEALICKAEAEGISIQRRSDADPAVVLNYDPDGEMAEGPRFGEAYLPPRGAVNAVPPAPSAPAYSNAAAALTVPHGMGPAAASASFSDLPAHHPAHRGRGRR